jgi:DNA-binding CsgD family transcriptional regulator
MKYSTRIYYTEADKALIWERWRKGETLTSIARHFGRGRSSIQGIVARSGGIRPVPCERSPRALSLCEREEISRAMVSGRSLRSVAAFLGRSRSTVSREITRNGGRHDYRASHAGQAAWSRAQRPSADRGPEADEVMGPPTDRRLAQADVSPRRDLSGVPRDDILNAIHTGPWCLEERTITTSEASARDAPSAPCNPEDRHT